MIIWGKNNQIKKMEKRFKIEKQFKRKLNRTPEEEESIKKYLKKLETQAKKFPLTGKDLSHLYDFMYIADTPKEIDFDFRLTLKKNGLLEWYHEFFEKVERVVIPELYEKSKGNKK